MKTRIVHTRFWTDSFVSALSIYAQHLFLYVLTNDAINQCGIYELPDKKILSETNLSRKQLDEAKAALSGKVTFRNGWVRVENSDKYNSYFGEKNERAREKEMALVPGFMTGEDTSIHTSMDRVSIHSIIINQKSETINQKPAGGYKSISDIGPKDVEEIAAQYRVSAKAVASTLEDLELYCGSVGKAYRNYRMTLMSWVRRKLDEGKLHRLPNAPVSAHNDREGPYVPPEDARQRLDEIRAKLGDLKGIT